LRDSQYADWEIRLQQTEGRRKMSVYSALSHIAAEWRSARDEARTRRIVNSLPLEIQKDIGWPDSHATRQSARTRTWSEYR
jgi:hypothetical protein